MESKVIDMVERMKDKDDLALEALFSSEPIADEGFTRGVVRRVRRRIWIRRLALPTAVVLGLAIAAKPAVTLLAALADIAAVLPLDALRLPFDPLPQLSALLVVAAATVALACLLPIFDDG